MSYRTLRGPLRRDRLMAVTGYFARQSARPGDELHLKASTSRPGEVAAKIVRIISGDPNPRNGGLLNEVAEEFGNWTFQGRTQDIDLGSYVTLPPVTIDLNAFTFVINVQPWLLRAEPSIIAHASGWQVEVSRNAVILVIGNERVTLDVGLRRRNWYRVWVSFDLSRGSVFLGCVGLDGGERTRDGLHAVTELRSTSGRLPRTGPRTLAAMHDGRISHGHFNGRMEDCQ